MTPAGAEAALRVARARVARAILAPSSTGVSASLGSITLREHQRLGADQLLRMLQQNGGALLADHVGVGKTYTALAVARHYDRPVVIAPAALRDVWRSAADAASIGTTVVSLERLSRADPPGIDSPDLVIVDEAHHLRSINTRRYASAATLCRHAHVLLLTATPVHNRRRDVEAQLALFLGSRALTLSDADLARHILRRCSTGIGLRIPSVNGPHALAVGADDDCLAAITSIPAPLPAEDEGIAGALTTYSLVHLWASSRAALVASLRRRRARALALRDALSAGHHPTKRELSAWSFDGTAVQLAFPGLVVRPDRTVEDAACLIDRLDEYGAAVSDTLARLGHPDPDLARARELANLRAHHAGARIVAFSQYAETVRMYARALWESGGLAQMTARGARIASGPLPRREVIAQFAPDQSRASTPPVRRIDTLLTTDLLSEGVNLHGASVIVHLDLPWNPARLEQREGRLRRLGSPHECIHVYVTMPPTAAERMLEIQRRLRDKLTIAGSAVGTWGTAGPLMAMLQPSGSSSPNLPPSSTESTQSTHDVLRRWSSAELENGAPTLVVAAVEASRSTSGFLGLVELGGEAFLVASLGEPASADPGIVHAAVRYATGRAVSAPASALANAVGELDAWARHRHVSRSIPMETASIASALHGALDRLAGCLARAPRHRRPTVASLAAAARETLTGRLSAGTERCLATLSRTALDDETWLQSVCALRATPRDDAATLADPDRSGMRSRARPDDHAHRLRVVILIQSSCAA